MTRYLIALFLKVGVICYGRGVKDLERLKIQEKCSFVMAPTPLIGVICSSFLCKVKGTVLISSSSAYRSGEI